MDDEKKIMNLIDHIQSLVKELRMRPDHNVQEVVDLYLKKMDRIKGKIQELKIRRLRGNY